MSTTDLNLFIFNKDRSKTSQTILIAALIFFVISKPAGEFLLTIIPINLFNMWKEISILEKIKFKKLRFKGSLHGVIVKKSNAFACQLHALVPYYSKYLWTLKCRTPFFYCVSLFFLLARHFEIRQVKWI